MIAIIALALGFFALFVLLGIFSSVTLQAFAVVTIAVCVVVFILSLIGLPVTWPWRRPAR